MSVSVRECIIREDPASLNLVPNRIMTCTLTRSHTFVPIFITCIVIRGDHVLFRRYAYVCATRRNRRAFVRMVWRCFRHLGKTRVMYTCRDYHMLVCLLCRDFPLAGVAVAARAVLVDDSPLDMLISFLDFLYAFQVTCFFHEALTALEAVFDDLQHARASSSVSAPTSSGAAAAAAAAARGSSGIGGSEGASSVSVGALLKRYSAQANADQAVIEVVRAVASSSSETFEHYAELLHRLAVSDAVSALVGALPRRSLALVVEIEEEVSAAMAAELEPVGPVPAKHKKRTRKSSVR